MLRSPPKRSGGARIEAWAASEGAASLRDARKSALLRMRPEQGAILQGGLRAENDGGLGRQHSAVAVRQHDLAVFHLTRAAFAAKLAHRLDQEKQPVHA